MQSGHCAKGDACHFAHGDEELRRKEDVSFYRGLSVTFFLDEHTARRDVTQTAKHSV